MNTQTEDKQIFRETLESPGALKVPVETKPPTSAALRSAVAEILRLLDERSRRILSQRFGLDGRGPRTLQAIGEAEGVTRERIRQIEQAIFRLLWGEGDTLRKAETFLHVREALRALLASLGGVVREELLATFVRAQSAADRAGLHLLLRTLSAVEEVRESAEYVRHYRQDGGIAIAEVRENAIAVLTEAKRLLPDREFLAALQKRLGPSMSEAVLRAALMVPRVVVRTSYGEWGLRGWPEATPRGVGDKAYIILKRAGKPLHFTKVREAINATRFDRRIAQVPTVHNELIRDPRFILVGRGIYSLRELGVEPGTVADVLERVLRAAQEPLSRDALVEQVLRERIVQRNTIILALQNRARFRRVADGRFALAAAPAPENTNINHPAPEDIARVEPPR